MVETMLRISVGLRVSRWLSQKYMTIPMLVAQTIELLTHVLSGIAIIFLPDKEPKCWTVRLNTGHWVTLVGLRFSQFYQPLSDLQYNPVATLGFWEKGIFCLGLKENLALWPSINDIQSEQHPPFQLLWPLGNWTWSFHGLHSGLPLWFVAVLVNKLVPLLFDQFLTLSPLVTQHHKKSEPFKYDVTKLPLPKRNLLPVGR